GPLRVWACLTPPSAPLSIKCGWRGACGDKCCGLGPSPSVFDGEGCRRRGEAPWNCALALKTWWLMDKFQGTDYRKEAMAFWAQARADFATAVTLMDAGIYYASVFFSQQAAEKALKAAAAGAQNRSP